MRRRAAGCALEHDLCTGSDDHTGKDQAVGNLLRKFAGNQQGAAAIEYGLLAAGIAVAIIAVIAALGTNLNTTFTDVSSAVK
jgi:pilus assembly protein Flp/PilA